MAQSQYAYPLSNYPPTQQQQQNIGTNYGSNHQPTQQQQINLTQKGTHQMGVSYFDKGPIQSPQAPMASTHPAQPYSQQYVQPKSRNETHKDALVSGNHTKHESQQYQNVTTVNAPHKQSSHHSQQTHHTQRSASLAKANSHVTSEPYSNRSRQQSSYCSEANVTIPSMAPTISSSYMSTATAAPSSYQGNSCRTACESAYQPSCQSAVQSCQSGYQSNMSVAQSAYQPSGYQSTMTATPSAYQSSRSAAQSAYQPSGYQSNMSSVQSAYQPSGYQSNMSVAQSAYQPSCQSAYQSGRSSVQSAYQPSGQSSVQQSAYQSSYQSAYQSSRSSQSHHHH